MFRRTILKLASSLVVSACVAPTAVEYGNGAKRGAMQPKTGGSGSGNSAGSGGSSGGGSSGGGGSY